MREVLAPLEDAHRKHGVSIPTNVAVGELQAVARRHAANVSDKPRCYQDLVDAFKRSNRLLAKLSNKPPKEDALGPQWLNGEITDAQVSGDRATLKIRAGRSWTLTAQRVNGRWILDLDPKYYDR